MTSKDNTQPNASTARDTGNASAQYITWGTATPINYLSLVTILTPALFTLYDKIHRNDSLHGLTVHQECLAARLYRTSWGQPTWNVRPLSLKLQCTQLYKTNQHGVNLAETNCEDELSFLAASSFALARNFAVPVVHIIDGTDDPDWNDKKPQDAEHDVWCRRLLVNRHQLRLKR